MLGQNDNQIMGNSYLQRISNFSNQTKQQMLQYANRVIVLQNQGINQGRNNQKFEMQCKKEAKHYLNCLRKLINSGMFKKQSSWLNIVLRLFGKKYKKQAEQRQIQAMVNQSSPFNLEPINLINKPLNNHRFLILLLICRTMPKDQQHYFDVQLITLDGKIIYKIINLKNWQELQAQIERVKTYTHDILLLIQNKKLIERLLESNNQLSELLESFDDINKVKRYQRIRGRVLTQQQLQLNQVVFHIIDKYQLILQSLRYLIEPNLQIELSIDQLLAITFSYNILDIIGVNPNQSLRSQIIPFQSIIVKVLEREYQACQIRNVGVFSKDFHFPTSLQNAHYCLKCKIARKYVSCISCSIKEGKTMSLCLNCYESYHKELEKGVLQSKKQSLSTLDKWENINLQVQLMISD